MNKTTNTISPTHGGMTRCRASVSAGETHLPHARGDEPPVCFLDHGFLVICPTHVGMNRATTCRTWRPSASAPRTWG